MSENNVNNPELNDSQLENASGGVGQLKLFCPTCNKLMNVKMKDGKAVCAKCETPLSTIQHGDGITGITTYA